jgi:DNA-binding transcriptional LysR family regulator
MDGISRAAMTNVCIYSDNSAEIAKSLIDGYVDVGVFLSISDMPTDGTLDVIAQRDDELTWVRSKDFTLSPGAPIPLLTWPGQIVHDVMIQALERKGMIYRIAFSSPDYHARIAAATAGIGLTLLPKVLVPAPLIAANEYYLPKPTTPKLVLCAREDIRKKHGVLIEELRDKFFGI